MLRPESYIPDGDYEEDEPEPRRSISGAAAPSSDIFEQHPANQISLEDNSQFIAHKNKAEEYENSGHYQEALDEYKLMFDLVTKFLNTDKLYENDFHYALEKIGEMNKKISSPAK